MWVESEGVPGKGSTFHFTIQAAEAPATQVRSRLAGEPPELRGRSVLIVDDNATNRRILSAADARLGDAAARHGLAGGGARVGAAGRVV